VASKDEERFALERFRQASGMLVGQLVASESPDFLVYTGKGVIGVEVMRYLRNRLAAGGSAVRRKESLQERLIAEGRRIYEGTPGHVNVIVNPHFRHGPELSPRHVPRLAAALAGLVRQLIPTEPLPPELMSERTASWRQLNAAGLDELITHLAVRRPAALRTGDWSAGTAATVGDPTVEIEQMVREKEGKLAQYQTTAGIWLLIYSRPPASGFLDLDRLRSTHIRSRFDEVVVIDLVGDNYVLLT
jgi:hypothetical protein